MDNNIGQVLAKRAFLSPNREAYVSGHSGLRLTFRELNMRCNKLANSFISAGVKKEQRVAMLLMNGAEFMEAYFALAKIGAVVVPLNWRLVADELEFILKDSGATSLIFDNEFVETVSELHTRTQTESKTDINLWLQVCGDEGTTHFSDSYQEFRETGVIDEPDYGASNDDMLYIMYTSGTTGLPKGVVHTHNTALWAILSIAATTYYQETDRFLNALPMFHVGALTPLTVNVYRGATSVVMRNFEPVLAWQLLQKENISTGIMVPAMLSFMLQVDNFQRFDYSKLRWIMTGAAPVPASLTLKYTELGIGILQVYGLTETCGPACLMDSENAVAKPASTGKAFFHTDIRVVNEAGEDCGPDEAGEVLVRGAHIMREYWNRPEATAETIRDGWLYTGDIALMDEDGFVSIQDRIKDMIISGGENVYPAELEAVLLGHPDISDAAVIGQQNERWGESPFAILVRTNESVSEADVMEYCQGKLARFKQPQGVTFVDQIPRNPSGKILKRVLREQFPG